MAKPGDRDSLIAEINKLLNDEKLRKRLAENAYLKSGKFDVRLITQQFIELYEKLLEKRKN
jgi:glycosyltransferase involved in cell wall biosynthesis